MKRTIKYVSVCLVTAMALSACSDQFLQDKKNFDDVNTDVYNTMEGANARLNDIYAWSLPQSVSLNWKYPSCGLNDLAGMSTEEYSGFGDGKSASFVSEVVELSSMSSGVSVPDLFKGGNDNIQEMAWGRIRNINDFIAGITGSTLEESEKNIMLGQAYFLRAWCYYNLVKWYGGVPIVTEVLEPVEGSFTPRSSAKACIEFMLSDLELSASLLEGKTWGSDDWGRVTAGTALALKGRILLMWASPLFNRANDQTRWTTAYQEMKADLEKIKACGYGLYKSGSNVNGSDFAAQFTQQGFNPEAVFVSLFNNKAGNSDPDQRTNTWENSIRPRNTEGSGMRASAMLVDMFPMKDGRIPASAANHYYKLAAANPSSFTDDIYNYPFMNRDPRFYHTFGLPGFRWAYNGNASEADENNPSDGANYTLWNYAWYTSTDDAGKAEGTAYYGDNLKNNGNGVYVRKKSDDLDINSASLYNYVATKRVNGGPFHSGAQLIELRFAEVLLNLAEVACGAGDLGAAADYLQQVRDRAGVPAYSNLSDQAVCMSAILYERQVELAYEGKRFDDMRRWMLFDGGTAASLAEVPGGAPSTWKLTGWGGNTCEWLGFLPMNGQRRDNMEFKTKSPNEIGGKNGTAADDPLLKSGWTRPAGVNIKSATFDADLESLRDNVYAVYLERKKKIGDGRDDVTKAEQHIHFRPQYYFLGFPQSVSEKNVGLPQTIGWQDANNGGAYGTFDPLAE